MLRGFLRTTLFAVLFLLAPLAYAQSDDVSPPSYEHILSFKSDITVHTDRSMLVTEKIQVYTDGQTIRHGIYRDFPTTYKDAQGNSYSVEFTVEDAKMEGQTTLYHTERLANGIRVYLGDPDVLLPYGTYTFTLSYVTNRQLGFFPTHDELYWNVNGVGWDYTTDQVEALVHLPSNIPAYALTTTAYTGEQGLTGTDYIATTTPEGVLFTSTRALRPNEGLSIVVGWPKGYILPPTQKDKILQFLSDNRAIGFEILVLLGILLYYYVSWLSIGRDPRKGVVIAQYEAPEGLSATALRYHTMMRSDDTGFTVSILAMAVKGYITITDGLTKQYELTKTGNNEDKLSDDEKEVAKRLFSVNTRLLVSQDHSNEIITAKKSQDEALTSLFGTDYFSLHYEYTGTGIVLSFVGVLATLLFRDGPAGLSYIPPLFFFIFMFSVFVAITRPLWGVFVHEIKKHRAMWKKLFPLLFLVAVGGVALALAGSSFLSTVHIDVVILTMLLCISGFVAVITLRQRTPKGRLLQDHIDGFKLFLSVTEQARLTFHNPPERTPTLFEKFLPYALALGVEHEWAEQFTSVFADIKERTSGSYVPAWYVGSSFSTSTMSDFTTGFTGSLASAISSSSTPPGSSSGGFSGGGGGGSSGGGGGGGGGGGW